MLTVKNRFSSNKEEMLLLCLPHLILKRNIVYRFFSKL